MVKEKLGPPEIAFICDRLACENCSPECKHTFDIQHAANFEKLDTGAPAYFEKENDE